MPTQGNFFGMGNMRDSIMGGGPMFLIFILLIGVLLFVIFKNKQNSGNQTLQSQGDNALEILKKRFANSEISEDEYVAKKATLAK